MGDGRWARSELESRKGVTTDGADSTDGKRAEFSCGKGVSAVRTAVSPGSEGLRRRAFEAPGFRRTEGVGDTRMLPCVIL